MAKEEKQKQPEKKPKEETASKKKNLFQDNKVEEVLVRIAGYDVPGNKKLMPGLTRIKGVSWVLSKAVCIKVGLDPHMKVSDLSKEQIAKIEAFLKNPDIPSHMKNRQKDLETGETGHFIGNDLDMKKDFDIRRMKKIRSYRGIRHTNKLPVRGQRTRSNFRKKGQAVRVKKKK
jgi:small subunit ribosomal protein S13